MVGINVEQRGVTEVPAMWMTEISQIYQQGALRFHLGSDIAAT